MPEAFGTEPAPVKLASAEPQIVHVPQKPDVSALLHAAFTAIARVLAVRFQLLLSLCGGFILAVLAMQAQTPATLYVLIAYCGLMVLPLVWLEFSGRPR